MGIKQEQVLDKFTELKDELGKLRINKCLEMLDKFLEDLEKAKHNQ